MAWRRWRRRRAAVEVAPAGDPYAEYLAWKANGRPPLEQADFRAAIPLPATDDAPEDPVGALTAQHRRLPVSPQR